MLCLFSRSGMGHSMMFWLWRHRLPWLPSGRASKLPARAALRSLHSIPSEGRSDGFMGCRGTLKNDRAEDLAARPGTNQVAHQGINISCWFYNAVLSAISLWYLALQGQTWRSFDWQLQAIWGGAAV